MMVESVFSQPIGGQEQGSVKTQVTLLSFVDEHISEPSTHEGIDMSCVTFQEDALYRL